MTLDPLDLERRTDHGGDAVDGEDQGDEALAAPGIVTREILVVGAGCRDEAAEPARLELRPGAVEAAGEDFRGQGGFLGHPSAECGVWSAEFDARPSTPHSELRTPH